MAYPLAFLLTVCVEAALAAALRPGLRLRAALAAVAVSGLTHPLAWWASGALPGPFWARAALIEGAVVAAEAALLVALLPSRALPALRLSAATNGASFGVGLAWWWLSR